jgi:regulator of sigma E protease
VGIVDNVFFFLIAVACLISVHEFGHFLVARMSRTEVEIFSIGFGKPIFSARILEGRTLFQVCWFPIGGYVKFAEAGSAVAAGQGSSQESQFFASKSPWVRIAIAAAGPLANVLLTVLIFAIVFSSRISSTSTEVGYVEQNSPAAASGLLTGDSILQIGGREVDSWEDVVWELMRHKNDEVVTLKIERGTRSKPDIHMLDLVRVDGSKGGLFGIAHSNQIFQAVIGEVQQSSPADEAGLRRGDEIQSVNGKSVMHWLHFVEIVRDSPGHQLVVNIVRDGTQSMVYIRPDVKKIEGGEIGWIGASPLMLDDSDQTTKVTVETDPSTNVFKSLLKSLMRTADLLEMTCRVIVGMIVGNVSLSNISGPISIAGHAGSSGQAGFYSFLFFLGVLSISVAVINLLPLPALDGGQIILFAFEALRGIPVSVKFLLWWTRVGAVTIGVLMVLALANDIYNILK